MFSLCVPMPENSLEKDQWNYIFSCWDIDSVFILSEEKNKENDNWYLHFSMRNKNVEYIRTYFDINLPLVYLTPKTAAFKGEILLDSYVHPEKCCYIFGKNNSIMKSNIKGDKVFIDTKRNLYSWVAAGITIFDRLNKNGN